MNVVIRAVVIMGVALAAVVAGHGTPRADEPAKSKELPKAPGPLSPKEELATFSIVDGFKVELVASEPHVVDPVAMCFDEKGRLFVCEMRGYPNGGVGTGNEIRGAIKYLTDSDGDGVFGNSQTFAEGLRFPMGLVPYKNGLIVAVAPDLLYLQDTDGDGKADKTTVLYTGFNTANIQQMANSLQWGLDNWVYGIAGSDGGEVKSAEKPDAPSVNLRNRGFRFKPDVPASLEQTSSGGQYGLTADDYQHWFTATNSQHLRQIVLPEHYLKRNPYLTVPAVTIDIPDHGAAAKVFRISPFEPWRVERTTRRAGGADASRFPKTELVPGGFITSACSPLIYTGELFPKEFYGNNFVCDPANNLIHRERLQDNGVVFRATRAYPNREFLASTDNWFRPVHLTTGPDGAIYVLDFYREVIETPLSLPDDIKKQLNLESRGRGRIWRIAPTDFKPGTMPDLSAAKPTQLAAYVASANPWHRITAQRLLVQGQVAAAGPSLRGRLEKAKGSPARVNLLWTLQGLGELKREDVAAALDDPQPGTRENALRLIEPFVAGKGLAIDENRELMQAVFGLRTDPSPRVRFQLAFTAVSLPKLLNHGVQTNILTTSAADPWLVTAALSSSRELGGDLLFSFHRVAEVKNTGFLSRIAEMVGARSDAAEITRVVQVLATGDQNTGAKDAAILEGLGRGMRGTKTSLPAWLANPPQGSEKAVAALRTRFQKAAETALDKRHFLDSRAEAARLLAYAPFEVASPALAQLLSPTMPDELQLAAVYAVATHTDAKGGATLLANWKSYSPTVRAAALDSLLARPDRTLALLAALEKKEIPSTVLSPAQVQQLKTHPNAAVKAEAAALFKQALDTDRAKVVKAYAGVLDLKGDVKAGKAVFAKHCSACHKLDGVGNDVGANLLATLGNKSGEDLLVAVFDPNREVDPRYLTYQVGTADERVLTGIIVSETPTSVTIRRAEGAEDTILRTNLAFLRATSLSLMPVGLEKELKQQDVADLFAYLRTVGK